MDKSGVVVSESGTKQPRALRARGHFHKPAVSHINQRFHTVTVQADPNTEQKGGPRLAKAAAGAFQNGKDSLRDARDRQFQDSAVSRRYASRMARNSPS